MEASMSIDRNAENWEKDYSHRGRIWGGAMHHPLPLSAGDRVLELGCGSGKTCNLLLEKKCEIIGVDFSASALHLCRSYTPERTEGHFVLADVCGLPFPDASFDVIIAFHIIGHQSAEGRTICVNEAARVMRDGGTLYFSGFSKEDFRSGTGNEVEPGTFMRKSGIATHYFSEDEVLALFRGLIPCECFTRHWTMKVRGHLLPRAEIAASFKKNS